MMLYFHGSSIFTMRRSLILLLLLLAFHSLATIRTLLVSLETGTSDSVLFETIPFRSHAWTFFDTCQTVKFMRLSFLHGSTLACIIVHLFFIDVVTFVHSGFHGHNSTRATKFILFSMHMTLCFIFKRVFEIFFFHFDLPHVFEYHMTKYESK